MPDSKEWDRVKELFLSALEVEPSRRHTYLHQKAPSADLRRAVQELLDAHEQAGSFLIEPAAVEFSVPDLSNEHRFTSDEILANRFQIVRFIARGGMGEVYEAIDTELQSRVAIKTIRAEIAGAARALAQFKREVQLARQVTHPNVCRIFDLFRHQTSSNSGGVLFVSMELLHGETLSEYLQRTGRIPAASARNLLMQIAQALSAAHEAGILHRDLKPANIMLEPLRDGSLRAVITDFGLAWTPGPTDDTASSSTNRFSFGTPAYMSPEQIEGKPLTPVSDVYSLGLVAYEMLTGVRAFAEESPLLSALRRLKETPPAPTRLVPELGYAWDCLLQHCLDPEPGKRFPTARQFCEAIEKLPDDTHARNSIIGRWTELLWRRHLVKLAAIALAGAVLACGAFLLVPLRIFRRQTRTSPDSLSLVLADFVNTTGEPVFDHTLNTALAAKLQQSPFLDLMPQSRIDNALQYMGLSPSQRLTSEIARQVCQRESAAVVLQGMIMSGDNGYNLELKATDCDSGKIIATDTDEAPSQLQVLAALNRISDRMRRKLGESSRSILKYSVPIQNASTSSFGALAAYSAGIQVSVKEGQYAARPYYLRAVKLDPNFALAYAKLSTIDWNRGDIVRARQAATRAYNLIDRVTQWERFFIASNYYGIVTGDIYKEMRIYRQWSKIYPHDDRWPLELSVDDSYFGRYRQANSLLRLALHDNPDLAIADGNLGLDYLNLERPDETQAVINQAAAAHLFEVNLDWDRYWLAFYNHDHAQMQQICAKDSNYPGVAITLLIQQARTAAYYGRLDASRRYAFEAADDATGPDRQEFAPLSRAEEALWEADFLKTSAAEHDISKVLEQPNDRTSTDLEVVTALVLSSLGQEHRADTMIAALKQQSPHDTLLNQYWIPVIAARIDLHEHRPRKALQVLKSSTPFETGIFNPLPCMYSVYERGQAHLALGEGELAAADFKELLAHRGIVLNCPTGALAELGLARSLALTRNIPASRAAYQNLFALWDHADKNLSLMKEAKLKYHKLR